MIDFLAPFISCFMQHLQLFVLLVWVLVSGIVWGWYMILRPYLMYTEGLIGVLLHAVLAHWLLINIMYHYYQGTSKSPGMAPIVTPEVFELAKSQNYACCDRCQTVKPLRSHHCSVCRGCVLGMDHHCPWLNNCVGRLFMWCCLCACASVSRQQWLHLARHPILLCVATGIGAGIA
jgi:hypothetical protein